MSNENGARNRLALLFDENSFVELKEAVKEGVITGYGRVDGAPVYAWAQDPETLGGSVGRAHAEKIADIYRQAVRVGAPVVGYLDSTGLRLSESFDAAEALASIVGEVSLASGFVPTVNVACGNVGGGMAALACASDFTFMEEGSRLYVNSPDAVEGNSAEKCDSASAAYRYESGDVDGIGDASEIAALIRKLIAHLPGCRMEGPFAGDFTDDLNRAVSITDPVTDPVALATEISDDGLFIPYKGGFAKNVTCGLIALGGMTVGVVAGGFADDKAETLDAALAAKAASFIRFCDRMRTPVLFGVNLSGYARTAEDEALLPGALADLSSTIVRARVPKVALYAGCAGGSAYALFSGRAMGMELIYAYPGTRMELATPEMLNDVLPGQEIAGGLQTALEKGLVDRVINPADTRKYLISAFDTLFTAGPGGPPPMGMPPHAGPRR